MARVAAQVQGPLERGDEPEGEDRALLRSFRTLHRGLTLLELIAKSRNGMSVSELSKRSALERSTVSRLAAALREMNYLQQHPDKRYYLGAHVLLLSRGFDDQLDIRALAAPILRRLQEQTQQTVALAVREGDDIVYVDDYLPTTRTHVADSLVGYRLPLHATAMGRVILARLDEAEREEVLARLQRSDTALPPGVELSDVRDEVARAASEGWATVDRHDDVVRIAAAVMNAGHRPIGAVCVSGLRWHMADTKLISEVCMKAADQITAAFGAGVPDRALPQL